MVTKVMYFSRGGSTKKVADAIAQAVGAKGEEVPPAYPADNIRLLFLGSGIYGGKIDRHMKEYIETLNGNKVKNAALFGTSGNGRDDAIRQMREMLTSRGIHVLDESFVCKGKFFGFFNRKFPDGDDLKRAQEYASKVAGGIKE